MDGSQGVIETGEEMTKAVINQAKAGAGSQSKGKVSKDKRFADLQDQLQALKDRERQLKEQRQSEIGGIFAKMGLADLDDAVFYGIADWLRSEGEESPKVREFEMAGNKIKPKQAGRKAAPSK